MCGFFSAIQYSRKKFKLTDPKISFVGLKNFLVVVWFFTSNPFPASSLIIWKAFEIPREKQNPHWLLITTFECVMIRHMEFLPRSACVVHNLNFPVFRKQSQSWNFEVRVRGRASVFVQRQSKLNVKLLKVAVIMSNVQTKRFVHQGQQCDTVGWNAVHCGEKVLSLWAKSDVTVG